MKSRTLGKSGIVVSEIGLGCWQLGGDFGPLEEDRARRILDAATEGASPSGTRQPSTAGA